jgi:hypothetical protein
MMEEWNNGMVGNTIGSPIFQHSIIPIFQSFPLCSLWLNNFEEINIGVDSTRLK